MTEQTPLPPAEPPRRHEPEDDAVPMPRWVPIAIGVVLVTLAALAVITGMRYRDQTLVRMMKPRHRVIPTTAPAPPGEPEPGASLMFPGDSNVPQAREPVGGPSRAEIAGGPGGVQGMMRMTARRGMRMNVIPSDAVVYVNDVAIGQAAQFDSQDEEYDFAAPGSYVVRLVAPGYKERGFIVTAAENAQDEVAMITVKLDRE